MNQKLIAPGLTKRLLPLTCVIVLALSSCGDDDRTSSDISKSEFVKKANSICAQGLKEKDAVVQAGLEELAQQKKQSRASLEELADEVLPTFHRLAGKLDSLPIPSGDEEKVNRFVEQLEAGLQEADENPSLLIDQDPLREAGATARAYGLQACNL